ncbi:hypothetical protein Aduo_008384 [Ancylostoma duodenale]
MSLFLLINLKELIHKWTPSARCHKEDLVTQCVDFVCFYLVRILVPARAAFEGLVHAQGHGYISASQDTVALPVSSDTSTW